MRRLKENDWNIQGIYRGFSTVACQKISWHGNIVKNSYQSKHYLTDC